MYLSQKKSLNNRESRRVVKFIPRWVSSWDSFWDSLRCFSLDTPGYPVILVIPLVILEVILGAILELEGCFLEVFLEIFQEFLKDLSGILPGAPSEITTKGSFRISTEDFLRKTFKDNLQNSTRIFENSCCKYSFRNSPQRLLSIFILEISVEIRPIIPSGIISKVPSRIPPRISSDIFTRIF